MGPEARTHAVADAAGLAEGVVLGAARGKACLCAVVLGASVGAVGESVAGAGTINALAHCGAGGRGRVLPHTLGAKGTDDHAFDLVAAGLRGDSGVLLNADTGILGGVPGAVAIDAAESSSAVAHASFDAGAVTAVVVAGPPIAVGREALAQGFSIEATASVIAVIVAGGRGGP